jgi:hypothetical protein
MNGSNGSTSFPDSSNSNLSVTAYGDAKISTSQYKWNGSAGAFDGTGDYLAFAPGAFGANNFAIETWLYVDSFVNYRMIYDSRSADGDTSGFAFGINASGQLFVYCGGFAITTGVLSINTWTHVALTRESGAWRIFVNGTLQFGSYTNTGNLSRTAMRIGMDWATLYGFSGYLNDYRITNNAARYTASFSAPVDAFPNY